VYRRGRSAYFKALNTRITVFGVVLIGLWLIAVAMGFIPVPAGTLHAPQWVLGVIGALFVLGGLLAATSSGGRVATALAASLLTLLGALGAWVAACGESDMMRMATRSGAVAITVPAPQAPLATRIAFGVGALIVLGWAGYAWRRVFKLR
jgi:hypothetical protein